MKFSLCYGETLEQINHGKDCKKFAKLSKSKINRPENCGFYVYKHVNFFSVTLEK